MTMLLSRHQEVHTCFPWMPPCIFNIKPKSLLAMPAMPKKPIRQGRVTPSGGAVKRVAAKKEPLKSTKAMEVLSLVEEVVEEANKEMVANAIAPQSYEVELIPVKNYSKTVECNPPNMVPSQEKKVEDAVRRRMSSESSDHQRRIHRGDSEVKIEEILCRVFEDITTQPKDEKRPTAKSRSPMKRTSAQKPAVPRNSPKVFPRANVAERAPQVKPVVKRDDVQKANGQIKPTVTKVELRKAPPKIAFGKKADPKVETAPVRTNSPRPAVKIEAKATPTRTVVTKATSQLVKKPAAAKPESPKNK